MAMAASFPALVSPTSHSTLQQSIPSVPARLNCFFAMTPALDAASADPASNAHIVILNTDLLENLSRSTLPEEESSMVAQRFNASSTRRVEIN